MALEQSFSGPDGSDGADIFQSECESKAAFHARADIELADLEAQSVAARIIANLSDRPLEKGVLNVVRKPERGAQTGLVLISVSDSAAHLVVRNLNGASPGEKIRDGAAKLTPIRVAGDAGASK